MQRRSNFGYRVMRSRGRLQAVTREMGHEVSTTTRQRVGRLVITQPLTAMTSTPALVTSILAFTTENDHGRRI
jgi:hypothetical protein